MLPPKPADVKPRVVSPETHENLLLEDVIESCLARGRGGVLELVGSTGAGKSTALADIASRMLSDRIVLVDDARPRDLNLATTDRLVVYATSRSLNLTEYSYELSPWSTDDVIEYLLATQPDQCSSIIAKVLADKDCVKLDGSPALYCLVLEQLAASDQVRSIRTALRNAIGEIACDERTLEDARFYAAAMILHEQKLAVRRAAEMLKRGVDFKLFGLLNNQFVKLLLTADRIVASLLGNAEYPFPTQRFPRELVVEIANLVNVDQVVLSRLRNLISLKRLSVAPMVASVLFAVDPQWCPNRETSPHLRYGYFSNAQWQSADLQRVNFTEAELQHSDLRSADLRAAKLNKAKLAGITAEGADFGNARAIRANFAGAELSNANLSGGCFRRANFSGADLCDAIAAEADFRMADLTDASLHRANLQGCNFRDATLTNVDLQDADLRRAQLSRQDLRTANLNGANMEAANLRNSDLEFVHWPNAQLRAANLTKAYLTASNMTGANLRHAKLNGAGLADIKWEQADLRGADLRECSFHMGSSRSGLVGSPYPCHGTRTGFYTNDYDDQSYKAPEEIRKANLRGADLRGALIDGVDFYLVDLRDAKYDSDQELHFRRCDAILVSRMR